MKHYYISDLKAEKGFREVTETEFEEYRQFRTEVNVYAEKITNGELKLEDVPETHRAAVEAKIAPTTAEKAKAYDILVGNEVSE